MKFQLPPGLLMTNPNHEQDAINAYLKLMEKMGADSANLKSRKDFLLRLATLIGGQPRDGEIYREAVDETLQKMNKAEWPFYLGVSREYYRFWTDDIKAIAALHASGSYRIAPLASAFANADLQDLWNNLDRQQLEIAEKWALKAYSAALRHEGAEQSLVDTRAKLVKLLLVRLRESTEKDGKSYQAAVDALIPLFSMKETRRLFMVVVREFFYFWIGDPDAASHIALRVPD